MKKHVLRFFSLVLILLIFCTIVSPKVEEEMATLVEARHAKPSSANNLSIRNIAVIWQGSDDALYCITEGTGWESGLRITEIPSTYFDRGISHISLGTGKEYWYIYSASRQPVAGDAIMEVEVKKGADIYLLWTPGTFGTIDFGPSALEILAAGDNAALIRNPSSQYPFFEHNAWFILREKLGDDLRIYSMHDVEQMARTLPWVAAVFAVLLCAVILWSSFWKEGRSKAMIAVNVLLIGALFACLPKLLGQFDLPASLMPPTSILDISYYAELFDRILSSMDALGDPRVQEWLTRGAAGSALILGAGALAAVLIVVIEEKIFRPKTEE